MHIFTHLLFLIIEDISCFYVLDIRIVQKLLKKREGWMDVETDVINSSR